MTDIINGRTPEEIKRILRWINFDCAAHKCDSCPNEDICSLQNGNEAVMAKNALDLIEHLESERDAALAKVPKWISVKERLPEEVCRCLVITKRHEESSMVNTATYNHMGWWTRGNFGEVTHWMPLPSVEELK